MTGSLVEQLRDVVGPGQVLTAPDLTAGYVRDWTGRFVGSTAAVVRPGTPEEVAGVVAVCRGTGTALVPQGGNTGLVGGGVPLAGEVLLSLSRLAGAPVIDEPAGQAMVTAGTTIAALRSAAAAAGLSYGVDLASRDSATVGGTIATNAGGIRVLRYGDTRAQLVGLEAVLGDGSVVSHLGGITRDNTGYHLPSLVCGSEGTLAIVTRARVRLWTPPRRKALALAGFGSVPAAVRAAAIARRDVPGVEAIELMLETGLALVRSVTGLPAPFATPATALLLIEAGGSELSNPLDALSEVVSGLPGVLDAALAGDARGMAALWSYRERHTEAINTVGSPVKLDVTLPIGELAEFLNTATDLVAEVAPGAQTWLFGHVADGNVHVNVTGAGERAEAVEDAVLRRVAALGGSIACEHGIGTAKKRWLHLARSAAELDAFRRLKRALDPDGILNPNVLLPL